MEQKWDEIKKEMADCLTKKSFNFNGFQLFPLYNKLVDKKRKKERMRIETIKLICFFFKDETVISWEQ